jgi:hypothetical protein
MDYDIELRFRELTKELEKNFGPDLDTQAILFLIGVQELGLGYRQFTKQEKTELLHVAVCTILEPYGYYEFEGRDVQQWPHFKLVKELPQLNDREQQHLIKEAIMEYFQQNGIS